MGEATKIEWATHTFNPWWGCTKVSPACAHCYAEALAKRTGKAKWGDSGTRVVTSPKYWQQPAKWNRAAEQAGTPAFVFCASMADVFEDWTGPMERGGGLCLVADFPERIATMDDVRAELWKLVDVTPWLTWLLLTKRPENVCRMVPDSWVLDWPDNVWVGTTVEDQEQADKRLPELLAVPARVRFLSCEPLLGPVDLRRGIYEHRGGIRGTSLERIHWVIAGGESGPGSRPSHPDWFRSLKQQCYYADVPFFFKQWGDWVPRATPVRADDCPWPPVPYRPGCPDPYPLAWMDRVGKAKAGRLLDGVVHNDRPLAYGPEIDLGV